MSGSVARNVSGFWVNNGPTHKPGALITGDADNEISRSLCRLTGEGLGARRRWVRVVPHVIDTALLASAVALAVTTSQYPFVQPWLTAKVLALLRYTVLGSVAIRHGRTRRVRIIAWLLALVVFGYIVAVARARVAFPWGA